MVDGEYVPKEGELAYDEVKDVVARVMEVRDRTVTLRPPNGGIEWDRSREFVRRATAAEQLSPRVAQANADSRSRV